MTQDAGRRGFRWILFIALVSALAALGGVALLINIFERKQEAKNPFYRVVELDDQTEDPAIWGKNFPMQYDGYRRTVDQIRTRFGGSEAVPRVPSQADPRSMVAQSRLEEDQRLKTMWAGYAFSRDFREERGHAYMLEDQTYTERQQAAKQPGTCMHCHASVYVPYKKLGGGDLFAGFEEMNQTPYSDARKLVTHPVGWCQTCHKWSESELQARVEIIQERTFKLRNLAIDALVDLIHDLRTTRAAGQSDTGLTASRQFQRKAQFLLDFIEAENSMGFHAPQETARILGESINFSRQGQVALRNLKVPQ